jgi:pyruvyl transferase EpsO
MQGKQQDICSILQKIIRERLTPLIDSDYIYLELPYHSNIGDTLIWMGTDHFLREIPHKCLGQHSTETYDFRPLPQDAVILLHGGGNFGDIWRQHQNFRLKVIETYPNNRIIILPQTVYYQSEDVLKQDVERMNLHQHLIICARDNQSAEVLQKAGYSGQMLTLPDMAFCIDRSLLCADRNEVTKDNLLLLRNDKESPQGIPTTDTASAQMDIRDWPNQREARRTARRYIRRHTAQQTDTFFQTSFLPSRVREGVRFVSEYQMVYSTRLHVAILRLLLGMPVKMMNNSYGKNLNFYNTWLKDCELIGTPNEEEQRALGMAIYVQQQEQKKMKRWKKIYAFILTFLLLAAMAIFLVSIPTK